MKRFSDLSAAQSAESAAEQSARSVAARAADSFVGLTAGSTAAQTTGGRLADFAAALSSGPYRSTVHQFSDLSAGQSADSAVFQLARLTVVHPAGSIAGRTAGTAVEEVVVG